MRRSLLWILIMLALVACGGTGDAPSYSAEMISNGESLFKQTCFACHGPEGKGIPNLGKDLTTSAFVKDSTDGELLAYVLEGRPADDPANTTGIAMPPKGGFDFLSNDDIEAIIAFVRSIDE